MIIPITGVDTIGLNKDYPPILVPPRAWTSVANVRFFDGGARKPFAYESLFTPAAPTYGLFPVNYNGQLFWAFAGLASVEGYSGGSTANITRISGPYTGTEHDAWNGGIFNELLYLNNGVDVPQIWNAPDLGTPLEDLPNWPASTTAKVLRNFKQFLIALSTTESATFFRRRVRWSHSATMGLPSSWDETDPTLDAGVYDLPEGDDSIVYAESLGDAFVIYTEGQTWYARLSDSATIFNFFHPFDSSGILSQRCCVSFRKASGPNMHFVVTHDDFVIHDLTRLQSVADQSIRRWFFANLDSSAYQVTHTIHLKTNKEIWVLFPRAGSGLTCTGAMVWNYETGVWSFFDEELIPSVRAAAVADYGISYVPEDTWDAGIDEQWDSGMDIPWSTQSQETFAETLLMAPPASNILLWSKDTYTADGVPFTCSLAQEGLTLIGASEGGEPVSDGRVQKMLLEVWPVLEGPDGLVVTVEAGAREYAHQAVTYSVSTTFTLGTDKVTPLHVTGRYLSLRYSWSGTEASAFIAHAPDIVPLGVF